MAIVLRSNKSTALTFEELDGNFTDLNSRVSTIETTNVTAVNGQSGNITLVTDNINEGSTNLYYTNARFDTRLGTKTTDNLTEGTTNKYYSDSLVDTRLGTKSIDALSDVDTTTSAPSVSDVLTWDGTKFKPAAAPGASGGEANTGSNIGTGRNLFKQKVGVNLEFNTLRSSDSIVSVVQNSGNDTVDISFLPTGDISANTQKITNVVNPASAQDAATKNYVDGLVAGLKTRIIVRAATTANIDLTQDLQNGDSLDGLTLATNDKVLVKNQTNQTQNGIYVVVASGTSSRDPDFDTVNELAGQMIIVKEGSNNADTFHLCTTDSGTIGSANITFTQVTPSGGGTVTQVIASTGLTGGTITTTGTIDVDVGTIASKIVQLDGSARLPAVDGSQLTNLPATGATAGFAVAMAIAL